MVRRLVFATCLLALLLSAGARAQNSLAPARTVDLPAPALQPLVQGLVTDMDRATSALAQDGHRREGTEALDRARRIARVLSTAAAPASADEAQAALGMIERARHALQDGDTRQACDILRQGSHQLLGFAHGARASRAVGPADEGMLVADAEGRRLGHLDRLVDDHGRWQAVLQVGGVNHLFGFIDWGNRAVTVPAADLVPGDRMLALEWPTTVQDLVERHGQPPAGVQD